MSTVWSCSTTAPATSGSAQRALERLGAEVTVTADRAAAEAADGLVLPGVGAYAACMAGLRAVHGPRLVGRRLAGGRPVLGICVGMQVLFDAGDEHGVRTEGFGEWPGVVERLDAPVLPHMGWNTVTPGPGSVLFAGVEDAYFYFVHSYAARRFELEVEEPFPAPVVTWAEHGERVRRRGRERAAHARPSSTPRSPVTPVPRCWRTGWRR